MSTTHGTIPSLRHAFASSGARAAIGFLAVVLLLAVYAPLLASGHPIVMTDLATGARSFPLLDRLSSLDSLLAIVVSACLVWIALPGGSRARRIGASCVFVVGGVLVASVCGAVSDRAGARDAARWLREAEWLPFAVAGSMSLIVLIGSIVALRALGARRCWVGAVLVALLCTGVCVRKWSSAPQTFPYESMRRAGEVSLVYTVVPFSPGQRPTDRDESLMPAMTRMTAAKPDGTVHAYPPHALGTDADGKDVLAQLVHGCRLAALVGLVAAAVALGVGVTLGALMGWFGGLVDAALLRVVEVFMSLPVLFVLIVAAGLFPRSALVMALLIGMFSWQSVARLTRAEFYGLREADFVLAARAQGIGRRSILFRHMLPSGLSPALVDAAFTVSAAVLAEAVISYLGFGPSDRASWGRLLAQSVSETGGLVPHLAYVPGAMIFLTVLSANAIASSASAALDPAARGGAR